MLPITALYAGLLALMATYIASIPGRLRGSTGISIGDAGNPDMLLGMRRHANFVENVPLALILIAILELNGVGSITLHVMGIALVVFRICHAVGLKADTIQSVNRLIGAAGTALLTVVTAIWAVVIFVRGAMA